MDCGFAMLVLLNITSNIIASSQAEVCTESQGVDCYAVLELLSIVGCWKFVEKTLDSSFFISPTGTLG